MIFWLNAQLPPSLEKWLSETFGVNALTLQELGLQDAQDIEIFNAARAHVSDTVVVTNERDFVD
jgi:predicted nuclease of predicted toxin-antitoxin system